MPTTRAALTGAVLLAQRDPSGMDRFDCSVGGFWHSFSAALVAAPAFLLLRLQQTDAGSHGPGILAEAVSYGVGWVAFPIVAAFLTRLLGLASRYVPLVVAANWTAVVQLVIFVAATYIAQIFGNPGGPIVVIAAILGILVYQWYVIRVALQTSAMIAAGFVVVDLLTSILLSKFGDLFGG